MFLIKLLNFWSFLTAEIHAAAITVVEGIMGNYNSSNFYQEQINLLVDFKYFNPVWYAYTYV